jgi:hypothetical protein
VCFVSKCFCFEEWSKLWVYLSNFHIVLQSIIYYAVRADKLEDWLQLDSILGALKPTLDKHYAELDPVFNGNIDEDYDNAVSGVTRSSFCSVYLSWIQYCVLKREKVRVIAYSIFENIFVWWHLRGESLVEFCLGVGATVFFSQR